jgi:hypothetical protein
VLALRFKSGAGHDPIAQDKVASPLKFREIHDLHFVEVVSFFGKIAYSPNEPGGDSFGLRFLTKFHSPNHTSRVSYVKLWRLSLGALLQKAEGRRGSEFGRSWSIQ